METHPVRGHQTGFALVPELLTLPETATLLRKSEKQLRWMVHQRTAPPSIKIGSRRLFPAAELNKYLEAALAAENPERK